MSLHSVRGTRCHPYVLWQNVHLVSFLDLEEMQPYLVEKVINSWTFAGTFLSQIMTYG